MGHVFVFAHRSAKFPQFYLHASKEAVYDRPPHPYELILGILVPRMPIRVLIMRIWGRMIDTG